MGGKLILRVEDTDLERSKEYEDSMVSNMKWLGVTFDEGAETQESLGRTASLKEKKFT